MSSELRTAEDSSKSSTSTIKTGTISMASDLSGDKKSADSSIHTESSLKDDGELSKTESIAEEIGSEHGVYEKMVMPVNVFVFLLRVL